MCVCVGVRVRDFSESNLKATQRYFFLFKNRIEDKKRKKSQRIKARKSKNKNKLKLDWICNFEV